MRRSTKLIGSTAVLLAAAVGMHLLTADAGNELSAKDFDVMAARSHSEEPQRGLASDWVDCLAREEANPKRSGAQVVCKTWTEGGLTSELIALKFGTHRVPVIESRSTDARPGPVVVDITGGPGGTPFSVDQAISEKEIAEMRGLGGVKVHGVERQAAYFRLLQRGFTIASIGYWGTSFRTLNAPKEMKRAIHDVRTAIDYYRDRDSAEPALLITSLGNHLALGALGKDRLEAMNFLAQVPVMDGLQYHLRRVATERQRALEAGQGFGQWIFFNIYRETEGNSGFDHVRMLPIQDFFPQYVGTADYPWHDVNPQGLCSRIILGNKDPRTVGFLASGDDLPNFITVLAADHDLFENAPQKMRRIFDGYSDCLMATAGSRASD